MTVVAPPAVVRTRRRPPTDPLTSRALALVEQAPPHTRLLALANCSLSEFATRLVPTTSRSRLRAVLEQAEQRGRMTREWAGRLGRVVDASADDVLALFAIEVPSVRGRPRRRFERSPAGAGVE